MNEGVQPYPIPAVVAAFRRLCSLPNQHRFANTARLVSPAAGGRGFAAAMFQHPHADWHLAVRSVSAYPPLSFQAITYPRHLHLIVDIRSPVDLFIAGGGGFPRFWSLERAFSGDW